jgi:hypothetical protein
LVNFVFGFFGVFFLFCDQEGILAFAADDVQCRITCAQNSKSDGGVGRASPDVLVLRDYKLQKL